MACTYRCTCNQSKCSCMSDSAVHVLTFVLYISSIQQYVCMVITYGKSMDQPGKVANPARGHLNREMNISLYAFALENLVSRDGLGSPVLRQPAHLHTQAEYGAYIRDPSRFPQRRPLLYLKRPDAIESVPSLSDHAIAHRWRSLPRVRRHRASKPLLIGSSERALPFCRSPCTN